MSIQAGRRERRAHPLGLKSGTYLDTEGTLGGQASLRRQAQLTEEELVQGFSLLVANEWRAVDVRPFIRKVKGAPSVAAPYLVGHLARGTSRERETATMLLRLLAGPRVIMPLRDLLRNERTPDEARIAAAAVLGELGEPVNIARLTSGLQDPQSAFDSVWEDVLSRAQADESFLESLLQSMQDAPADEHEEVIRSLAEPRDPRALWLLRPLLYARRANTIVAAIEAIEAIGGTDALDDLKEVSESDPSERVRKRARTAYGRLFMRAHSFFPDPPSRHAGRRPAASAYPLYRCWVTLLDGRGHQAVSVARRRPDGQLKVLTIQVSETAGVLSCTGSEIAPDDLAGIEDELRAQGLAAIEVDLDICHAVLAEARRLNTTGDKRLPFTFEVWKAMLGAPSQTTARRHHEAMRSTEGDLLLLPETGSLPNTPEFRQWTFDPDLVWPYVDEWACMRDDDRTGLKGQQELEGLVTLAIADLLDDTYRRVMSKRLSRQAWLLAAMGKPEASKLAAAAAVGLDPERGVPAQVHPFVRAMVKNSFLNAGLRPPVS